MERRVGCGVFFSLCLELTHSTQPSAIQKVLVPVIPVVGSANVPTADIMKMVESHPELAPQLRRVRGGYLKIQGTWMPYEVCLLLLSARPFAHSTTDRTPFSPQVRFLHWITACSVL